MKGRKRKKQPFAYARKGPDGKWYHWKHLAPIAGRVAIAGVSLALAPTIAGFVKDLFSEIWGHGLSADIKDLFS